MKILFISPRSPDDRTCGGGVRSGFMLRALKELGDVKVVGVNKPAARFPIKWYLAVFYMFSTRVMDWFYRGKKDILDRMGLAGEEFDLVVVRYIGQMERNAAWKIAPCFVDVDDLPTQLYENMKRVRWRFLHNLLCMLRGQWQARLLRRSKGFWVCNASQIRLLEKNGKCAFLPNIAQSPLSGYRYEKVENLRFLTIGCMSYLPNCNGVDWFVDNVWRKIVKKYPSAVYEIVGSGVPDRLKEKWSGVKGISVLGFVDDLSGCYERANIAIVPIFMGAGTCVKVVEALLHGRKVISSTFGVRGLDDKSISELGIAVCETADAFVGEIEKWIEVETSVKSEFQISVARTAEELVSYRMFADSVKTLITEGIT